MTRIHLIATGGTIAMQHDEQAGGALVSLSGVDSVRDLVSQAAAALPELSAEEYGTIPSSHFTVDYLWGLQQCVAAAVRLAEVDGVVLTHGTDVLEETAYLLDLTVAGDKPIVLTGAMRVASEPGYEGIANLLGAVRVAATPEARALGALVVLNDEVHAARDVTKMHSQSTDTFGSPFWGPLGRVEADRVRIGRRVERQTMACTGLEPSVYLLKLTVGMGAELLEQAVALGARGLVIESFGGGRVPVWWLPAIESAIARGVLVVIATRCPSGRVYDRYGFRGAYHDLLRLGCLFTDELNGPKARLRLMAALGTARDLDEARRLFIG